MKAAVALVLVVSAFAQAPIENGRLAQQEAYRHWRETDPNLERDAPSTGATLGARADKVAAEATKYFSLQKNYQGIRTADARRSASLLEPVNVTPDALPNLDRFLTVQETILRSSISRFAADPDRAIQLLRASLERERTAIAAIATAVKDSQKSKESAAQTSRVAEEARAKISGEYQALAASLGESEHAADKSGAAWAGYYRALSDAVRGAAAPVTSFRPAVPSAAGEPAAVAPAAASEPGKPAALNPAAAPVASAPSMTPAQMARYVGAWAYPAVGGHFHGMQPASADLVVREENGQASGTLTVRFKLPAGSTDNPEVRFDFGGAFGNSRVQKFAVTTSGGAAGTLELIPGPAFNLIEVNFSSDDKPGVIRHGNFLLVKQ